MQIECWALPAFVLALLFGGEYVRARIQMSPGTSPRSTMTPYTSSSTRGGPRSRRQNDRFRRRDGYVLELMVTVDLALLAFLAALLHQVLGVHGDRKWWALGVWCAAALLAVTGTAAAAAVMAVKATFSGIDTTQITTWESPVLRELGWRLCQGSSSRRDDGGTSSDGLPPGDAGLGSGCLRRGSGVRLVGLTAGRAWRLTADRKTSGPIPRLT